MKKELFLKRGIEVFDLDNPNVIAHMPIIIGKLFMEIEELASRLRYRMPKNNAPFPTLIGAYDELMMYYLEQKEFILALESYKYAMTNGVQFRKLLAGLKKPVINTEYIPNEESILEKILKSFPNFTIEEVKYKKFLQERLRKIPAQKEILNLTMLTNHIKDLFPESAFGTILE